MRLYKSEGDTVVLLSYPWEKAERGDYLLIDDPQDKRGVLTQILDIRFVDFPEVLEDILREGIMEDRLSGEDYNPLQMDSEISIIKDIRLLITKTRGTVEEGQLIPSVAWLPSRVSSRVKCLDASEVLKLRGETTKRPIQVGSSRGGVEISVSAHHLDGGLSIVTGRKGTGKSHLSKLLLLGLVDQGAGCVVFDLNGEYSGLTSDGGGVRNGYQGKIVMLRVGENFKTTLPAAGLHTLSNILQHILELPNNSLRELYRIWRHLETAGVLGLKDLGMAIRGWGCNEAVREALLARYHTLVGCGFFTDEVKGYLPLDEALKRVDGGGALVIDLKDAAPLQRRIVVEFVLSKLIELLKGWALRALFLFAEEAHLYLRDVYWEDLVTRMRHIGIFPLFITNQPDSIPESIYRQADSIFLFNFTNERDLEAISRVSRADGETVKTLARSLQPHHCLALGRVTGDIPIVMKVRSLNIKTLGETRLFFDQELPPILSPPSTL